MPGASQFWRPLSLGSRTSRSQSPSRLAPSTTSMIARAGKTLGGQAVVTSSRASATILPQVGISVETPKPRKLKAGSVRFRAEREGGGHDDGRDRVGQDVAEHDAGVVGAEGAGAEPLAAAPHCGGTSGGARDRGWGEAGGLLCACAAVSRPAGSERRRRRPRRGRRRPSRHDWSRACCRA